MQVIRFDDPAAFAQAANPLLLRDEAANNLMLGLIPQLSNPTDTVLHTVSDGVAVVAAAMMTPGRPLILTDAPADAISPLVESLAQQEMWLPGVFAAPRTAQLFAERWAARMNVALRPGKSLAIHRLKTVCWPAPAPGLLRPATMQDLPTASAWIDAFARETDEPQGGGEAAALRWIEQERLFLWDVDGQPASMAAWSRPTPSGVAVSLVYTPPELRGRGYASNTVAALSQRLLDSGRKFCVLYTDLANPTSNKIYRQIGYERIRDFQQIFFDMPPGSS